MEKIKKFLIQVWSIVKWILGVIAGVLVAVFAGKLVAELSQDKIKYKRNWAKIDEKTIAILDENGNIINEMKLPIDPETGKQVKTKDISEVGLTKPEGKVYVTIKHSVTDRRKP